MVQMPKTIFLFQRDIKFHLLKTTKKIGIYVYFSNRQNGLQKDQTYSLRYLFFLQKNMLYKKLGTARLVQTYHVSNHACFLKQSPAPICRCHIIYLTALFPNRLNLLLFIKTSQFCEFLKLCLRVRMTRNSQESFLN